MRRAFTLVELAVVLAIIGILATLLVGIFARLWDDQKPPCSSNLR